MNYSMGFEFNGTHTSYFDVMRVFVDNGMGQEDYFLANKNVNTFKTKDNRQSHLTTIQKESLVIPVVLFLNGDVDMQKEQEIKEWLETDEYCKLQFDDEIYVYNAILNGQPRLMHDYNDNGYIELEFMTDSSYRQSDDKVETNIDDPLETMDGKQISITNYGNLVCKPIIEIIAPGTITDGIEIYNKTTQQVFKLDGEYTDLTMTIYNEYEELYTEGNFTDLYDNHNGQFIFLNKGKNELEMKGRFYYKIIYQDVYL